MELPQFHYYSKIVLVFFFCPAFLLFLIYTLRQSHNLATFFDVFFIKRRYKKGIYTVYNVYVHYSSSSSSATLLHLKHSIVMVNILINGIKIYCSIRFLL